MLRTRVITAVLVLALLLGMIFLAPALVWSVFVLVIALTGCWEWSRMSGFAKRGQSIFLVLSGVIGAALWLLYARAADTHFVSAASIAFIVAALFWIVLAPLWLARKARPSPLVCAIAGWIVMWPTWFAFVVLRDASPWLLLAIAAVIWVADIAAYFAGKRFGKHKLAPAVSPGKTWEGVMGALAGVAIYGIILAVLRPAPISAIFDAGSGAPVIAAMLGLAVLSVVGDLLESWMKRGAGLKDSSGLLPGHGGILDRIDALTSTLPVAAFALSLGMGAA
ncbi:MAG: phosphatidate cytidylyltransferase [Burkholderiales bacterium]|nr:phosphatidate cytidylyltransferase [Burkholderiales bacterium]